MLKHHIANTTNKPTTYTCWRAFFFSSFRFKAEAQKNNQMCSDLRRLQGRVAELERELAQARSAASAPQAQLGAMQNDLARESAKNQEISRL